MTTEDEARLASALDHYSNAMTLSLAAMRTFLALSQAGAFAEAEDARLAVVAHTEAGLDAFTLSCRLMVRTVG